MEGIDQAITNIAEMAKKTVRPHIIVPDESNPRNILLFTPDGKVERMTLEPRPHAETLDSIFELVEFSKKYAKSTAVIYVGEDQVKLVYDFDSRRDVAVCKLHKTPEFLTLMALAKGQAWMTQKDFIRLFRIELHRCDQKTLIQTLRQVKFAQSSNGETEIAHGKESMGRAITAAVKGVDVIPEDINLSLPVFVDREYQRVGCAIDIDVETQRFRCIPYPGQLEAAMGEALSQIKQTIEQGTDVAVFIGAA